MAAFRNVAEKRCSSKMLLRFKNFFFFLHTVGSAGHGGRQRPRHFVLVGRPKPSRNANFKLEELVGAW